MLLLSDIMCFTLTTQNTIECSELLPFGSLLEFLVPIFWSAALKMKWDTRDMWGMLLCYPTVVGIWNY